MENFEHTIELRMTSIVNKFEEIDKLDIDLFEKSVKFYNTEKELFLSDKTYFRFLYTFKYSWALPTKDSILKLKDSIGDLKVLSIGSGHCLWEQLLIEQGVNIIASDPLVERGMSLLLSKYKKNVGLNFTWLKDKSKFLKLDAEEACKKVQPDVLFCSWPIHPYTDG